jgi:TIR domain-containing protein
MSLIHRPVFISYARSVSAVHAQALSGRLGDLAFLDVSDIDDGDQFPQHLLTGMLDARVVVIFATQTYSERRFCRVEMRLALAGDDKGTHLVLALGEGAGAVLDGMPATVGATSWPAAADTEHLDSIVRKRLDECPDTIRGRLGDGDARRLATTFLDQANLPDPQSLGDICRSIPAGSADQSIGTRFVGRAEDLRRIHRHLLEGSGVAACVAGRIAAGAGLGKTRLAIEYLHRYGPRYYRGGLFWIDGATSDIEGEFWRVLKALKPKLPNLEVMRQQGRNIRRELGRALSAATGPVLYVVNDVPEAAPGDNPLAIEDLCPALGIVSVLVTSRQDTREEGVGTIPIDPLARDPSV